MTGSSARPTAEVGAVHPPEAYWSAESLRLEQERVFETTWSLVAAIEDVPSVGDAVDVTVGRYPIVVVHTSEGLRAFHNLCRHRGMVLVCGAEHVGDRLRCPYHGWEFATADGALVRLPQRATQFPDADLDALGLHPASVAAWEGLVFVHPSAEPQPFDDFLGDFPGGIGSFRPGELRQLAVVEIVGDFNWKLFVENHIDVYHLWYLHESTLADFDHPHFEHRRLGPNWVSYEPMRPGPAARLAAEERRGITGLADRDRYGIGAHLLFPNMTMASTVDSFITYAVTPVTPVRSRVQLRVRALDPTRADELIAGARSFIDEDIEACERVQRGLSSPMFDIGAFAGEHEQPIVDFHRELRDRLASVPVRLTNERHGAA